MATPLDLRTPKERKRDYDRAWKKANPGYEAASKRKAHERLKREVFDAYGGKCVCCGETDLHFLTIDHIDKVIPASHRTPGGRRLGGTSLLYQLRKEGYPTGCRALCWNCNCATGYYGFCPHQPHELNERRYA